MDLNTFAAFFLLFYFIIFFFSLSKDVPDLPYIEQAYCSPSAWLYLHCTGHALKALIAIISWSDGQTQQ